MSLSAATVAKKRKDKQLDAISQEHQSARERDDRLGTYAPEMGAEGLPYTEAWTQSDSQTYLEEKRGSPQEDPAEVIEKVRKGTLYDLVVEMGLVPAPNSYYMKNNSART